MTKREMDENRLETLVCIGIMAFWVAVCLMGAFGLFDKILQP